MHFSVIVATSTSDFTAVVAALEPFRQNNTGNCEPQYLVFEDQTNELRSNWEAMSPALRNEYAGFEAYADEFWPRNGDRWGDYQNPRGCWDWYALGGRWSGLLPLKPGCAGTLAVIVSGMVEGVRTSSGFADQAVKCDVDFARLEMDHVHAILIGDWIDNGCALMGERENDSVRDRLMALPDEAVLTVVDCHC